MTAKSQDTTHLRLRIRNDTLERLEKRAADNERTLTDEITRIIERGLTEDETLNKVIAQLKDHITISSAQSREILVSQIADLMQPQPEQRPFPRFLIEPWHKPRPGNPPAYTVGRLQKK